MTESSDQAMGGVRHLSSVPRGDCVRLVGIDTGLGFRSRLAAMGLVPGVAVRVLRNSGHGPAVVEVKGTRLALGRGVASKMQVE